MLEDKVEEAIQSHLKALTNLSDSKRRARLSLQLKELVERDSKEVIKAAIEEIKLFSTYDNDQRKFGIEQVLGTNSIALPTRITRLAASVGLEVYNSLSDEKKIYLNTEDLLIEVRYDVNNKQGEFLAVEISFTENEEEVKLSAEAVDLLQLLKGNDEQSLRQKLKALIHRTSLAVSLIKQTPRVYMRKLEAQLQEKLEQDSIVQKTKKTTQGIMISCCQTMFVDPQTQRIVPVQPRQRIILGVAENGVFNLSFE